MLRMANALMGSPFRAGSRLNPGGPTILDIAPAPANVGVRCSRPHEMFMTKECSVVIERDEDGLFVATVPSLPGCHPQATSLDELMARIREAIELNLEDRQEIDTLEFIGVQRVTVAA